MGSVPGREPARCPGARGAIRLPTRSTSARRANCSVVRERSATSWRRGRGDGENSHTRERAARTQFHDPPRSTLRSGSSAPSGGSPRQRADRLVRLGRGAWARHPADRMPTARRSRSSRARAAARHDAEFRALVTKGLMSHHRQFSTPRAPPAPGFSHVQSRGNEVVHLDGQVRSTRVRSVGGDDLASRRGGVRKSKRPHGAGAAWGDVVPERSTRSNDEYETSRRHRRGQRRGEHPPDDRRSRASPWGL